MRILPPLFAVLISLSCFAEPAPQSITGQWIFTIQQPDHLFAARGQLTASGRNVSGTADSFPIRGSVDGGNITLELLNPDGSVAIRLGGQSDGAIMKGTAKDSDGMDYTWSAERYPGRSSNRRIIDFTPMSYARFFSGLTPPVLRISAGDTVRTSSIDAGGIDASGKRVSRGGNPLTGPFYVVGALPGDTLVVKLKRITLNRDWAQSGTEIVSNAVAPEYTAGMHRGKGLTGRWHLDAKSGTASIQGGSDAVKALRVPLQPMLGGIGVAPPMQEVSNTRASGSFGGNMDYSRLRKGTTVYLPVYQPGALLLLGDAHAAEGDGELAGDALETSMDFEFTVDVIPNFSLDMPCADDGDSWMVIGIAGSLEEALRRSTTAMATYLEKEHGLNSNEAAMLLGAAMKYDVADVVGDQVSIVARLPKSLIAQLPPGKNLF